MSHLGMSGSSSLNNIYTKDEIKADLARFSVANFDKLVRSQEVET